MYGVAIPTTRGLRNVLDAIGAAPPPAASSGQQGGGGAATAAPATPGHTVASRTMPVAEDESALATAMRRRCRRRR